MKTVHGLVILPALLAAGCLQVKTESEIKPIHITMDVNLKVDKALDREFADETRREPTGRFRQIKNLLDRKVAGITNQAMLEAKEGASDADRILIAELNARRLKQFQSVATESGTSMDAVRRRHLRTMREHLEPGSGVWYQEDDGRWRQK